MGLRLVEPAVAALERQTEGWVAGLQLAAIALQEYADEQGVQAFVTTFAGNDRYIADYLVSEVLLHQFENAFFYQSRIAYIAGQLERALDICQDGLAQITPVFKNPDQEFPAIRGLYVMQGIIALERNQLAEAERLLELGTNRVGYAPWVEVAAYEALIHLWAMRGDAAKVSAILTRMTSMGTQIAACAEALRFQHLTSREPEDARVFAAARAWAQTHAPDLATSLVVDGIGPYQVDAEYVLLKAWLWVQVRDAPAARWPDSAAAGRAALSDDQLSLPRDNQET